MEKSISETFLRDCEIYFCRKINLPPEKPAMVILDITHRCNLNCVMCDISKDGFDPQKEFTTKEVFKIIDEMSDWGVKELVFSGGEAIFLRYLTTPMER
jgi:MoaA/NifB/PqqE/SkfB family radical SAM enzyme